MAHALMSEEVTPEDVRLVARYIDNMGHTRVVLNSDDEPAMKTFARRVKDLRTHLTVLEESPAYEPQSNGLAERCVQIVQGLFRSTRSALEHRLGGALPDDHPVLTWMVRHVACLHNRYHVGNHGLSPSDRVTGRRSK